MPKGSRPSKSELKGNNKTHTRLLKVSEWNRMKDREDPCPPIIPPDFNLYYAAGDEFDPDVDDLAQGLPTADIDVDTGTADGVGIETL